MNFNLQKFSADVKEFRKVNNLTQSEFAGKLELDNHTLVSLFEQGKRAPSKEVFAIIAELQAVAQKNTGKQQMICRRLI